MICSLYPFVGHGNAVGKRTELRKTNRDPTPRLHSLQANFFVNNDNVVSWGKACTSRVRGARHSLKNTCSDLAPKLA